MLIIRIRASFFYVQNRNWCWFSICLAKLTRMDMDIKKIIMAIKWNACKFWLDTIVQQQQSFTQMRNILLNERLYSEYSTIVCRQFNICIQSNMHSNKEEKMHKKKHLLTELNENCC